MAILRFAIWRQSAVINVRIFEFMSSDLLLCYSASVCKILLKSDYRLLSYGLKRFLKWRPSAILNFTNF